MIRFLRLHPFLWPVPLVILSYVASLWWEHGISYDDGGLGTASFLVVYTLGAPGLWFGELLSALAGDASNYGPTARYGFVFVGVVGASLPYVAMDAWTQRFVIRRSEQGE